MENVKKVYLLERDEYAVWITIQTIHSSNMQVIQGPKLKTEYRVETKFRKSGSMNGVRQYVDTNIILYGSCTQKKESRGFCSTIFS